MISKSLTEIANIYRTDKGTIGPSAKWLGHNYTDIYEAYFERYRWSNIKILEIGIGGIGDRWPTRIVNGRNITGGASLKMWYDYFQNAHIYGIDIIPASHLDNDRIHTFVGDQGNIHDLQSFMDSISDTSFDIIIDDGSHLPEHQQISLSFFFKKLKIDGLYFIEDLMTNGLGDDYIGRHISKVMNTRSVLKSFKESGKFAEPNALIDPTYLSKHIGYINFHSPNTVLTKTGVIKVLTYCARRVLARLLRKNIFHYQHDSEKLCVMRKK